MVSHYCERMHGKYEDVKKTQTHPLHDWDKSTIEARIMEVAGTGSQFTMLDLIRRWMGEHHSVAWEERLNHLVRTKVLREIKMDNLSDIGYKLIKHRKEGPQCQDRTS